MIMGKKIVRVTSSKRDAIDETRRINSSLRARGIKREAYVCSVSKAYVKKLTRKGYPVADKNYAIYVRDKR